MLLTTQFNNLEDDLTCPIDYHLLTNGVTLEKCAHKICEACAGKLYGNEKEGFKTAPCLICKAPVVRYAVDHTLRKIAQSFEGLQKSILEIKEPFEVKVEQKKPEAPTVLTSFNDVKKYVMCTPAEGIESLDLSQVKDLTDHELHQLASKLPYLKNLIVRSDKLTNIPFKFLKKLECSGCINITELSLDEVSELICRACTGLKRISAPLAEKIICNKCKDLTEIMAPQAKRVECWECNALLQLSLPEALNVDCSNSFRLAELTLPKATRVDCSNCGLKILSLPLAKWIKCMDVRFIKKQEFPEAETVICTFCEFEELHLPKVKLYDDFGCSRDMKIFAPFESEREILSI